MELFDLLNEMLNIKIVYNNNPPRISDQKVFIADLSSLNKHMIFKPKVSKEEGILDMINWVKSIKEEK